MIDYTEWKNARLNEQSFQLGLKLFVFNSVFWLDSPQQYIRPRASTGLKNLQELYLDGNPISDFSPPMSGKFAMA